MNVTLNKLINLLMRNNKFDNIQCLIYCTFIFVQYIIYIEKNTKEEHVMDRSTFQDYFRIRSN